MNLFIYLFLYTFDLFRKMSKDYHHYYEINEDSTIETERPATLSGMINMVKNTELESA